MEKQLFRKKSMDYISSPEQMHDYLRVTSPRVWMVLAAVLALLGGFFTYISAAGTEETAAVRINVQNSMDGEELYRTVWFDISAEEKSNYRPEMTVRFAGQEGKILFFQETEDRVGVYVKMDRQDADLADGEYEAVVVVESGTALSELLD